MNDHPQLSASNGSDTEIRWYLQDVAMMPTLTLKAEQEVVQQIATDPHSAEADAARTLLIKANLRLVVRFARRYQPFGLDLADLIQEGNLALTRAAHHFDPQRSRIFRRFASQTVYRALYRVVVEYLREKHLLDVDADMEPIHPLRAQVLKALAHNAIDEEALVSDLPEERFISLTALLAETDTDSSLLDERLIDHECCHDMGSESDPDGCYFAQERIALISSCLGTLTTRERLVLTYRYLTDPIQELQTIGRTLGITREMVRQIEQRGLRKLRHPHNARILLSVL